MTLQELREMIDGSEATILDAAYVAQYAEEHGIDLDRAADEMASGEWADMIDAALRAGGADVERVLRAATPSGWLDDRDWDTIRAHLGVGDLMSGIREWLRRLDQVVAETSETCLASYAYQVEDAIESAHDPALEVRRQAEWWARAYQALDLARSEHIQPHLEDVCERLLGGDLEGAEALVGLGAR